MPIRKHLRNTTAFEPEAIAAMSRAFEDACAALHILATDERIREIVATRVIDLARAGVTDARVLSERVLQESRSIA